MPKNIEPFHISLELRSKDVRSGVFTLAEIPASAPIVALRGFPLVHPTRYTVQVSATLHLDEGGLIDGHINHACAANALVDSVDPLQSVIRAVHPITSGSEITINYCASEDQIAEPFGCDCGADDCYGIVRGYSGLSPDQRRALGNQVSPYLLEKYGPPGAGTRTSLPFRALQERHEEDVEPKVKS